jgi:transposase-like protein
MKLPHTILKGDSKLCPRIVQLNEEIIKGQLKELVRGSVEETLNKLLEKEAESLTQAARYERSEARQGYRSGHYNRNLTTTSGDVMLHMPRLKGVSFETAIIERYRRRESGVVPKSKVKIVAKMLKAIHAQESKKASCEKAKAVVAELRAMKLKEAAKKVEDGIEEALTYCDFPSEHWTRIRTNNVIERLNREIRRRTRVLGTFPDGNSALMLVCARLRHAAGTQWGCKKYMNMKHLEAALDDAPIAG